MEETVESERYVENKRFVEQKYACSNPVSIDSNFDRYYWAALLFSNKQGLTGERMYS